MVKEETVEDMDLARDILSEKGCSFVIIKNGKILIKKQEHGVKTLLQSIEEFKDELHGCVIGQKSLGKASSLLCVHSKVEGVYSHKATKTAIAVLIIAGIPSEIDELVRSIENEEDDIHSFEKIVENISSPTDAYDILKTELKNK